MSQVREAWSAALPECYAEPIAACVAGTPAPAASAAAAAAAADADSSDEDGAATAPPPPTSASAAPERHKYHRLVAQRRAYGDAWLAVLALPASRDTVQVCGCGGEIRLMMGVGQEGS